MDIKTILEIGSSVDGVNLLKDFDTSLSEITLINGHRTGIFKKIINLNGITRTLLNSFKDKTLFDLIVLNNCDDFSKFSEDLFNILRFFKMNTVLLISIKEINLRYFNYHKHLFNNINMKILGSFCLKKDGYLLISCQLKDIINYEDKLPTIITSLYDIRSLETDDKSGNIKKLDRYLELGRFILSLEFPLIIYTEQKLVDRILEIRPKKYHHLTKIIIIPLEELTTYKYLNKIKELQKIYIIKNRSIEKDTPLYTLLVNNKFWFIEDAISKNHFDSTKFIWMDFGINHVAEYPESIRRWFRKIPDKIRCLETNLNLETSNYKEYFTEIRHNVAGGIISGNSDNMNKYIKLCQDQFMNCLDNDWYQLDEAMMGIVTKEYPDLCNTYYGSFNNHISGYDHYVKLEKNWSENTFNYMIGYSLNKINHKKCYMILNYIKDHYLYGDNKWVYLKNCVICNYYVSIDKKLDDDVIDSIFGDKPNIEFILTNGNNLKFYNNLK